jgi:structural maintenance of chromosomes protein 6
VDLFLTASSAAQVMIAIKNQGEDAFRPEVYGKTIHISRKFTKEGTSTWRMENEDRKLVSNKKEELLAIIDQMNIQVDNPLSVLTQDAARQFLSASSASDKYKVCLILLHLPF